MINFYGGQKGENYVVSKIFPNKNALLDDLRLEDNSKIGLYEIVMISYGEYSNYEESDYQKNLALDNGIEIEPGFMDKLNSLPNKENLINLNSNLYQKVPNTGIREGGFDISVEAHQSEQNNNPILRFKYRFLTSSSGEIPKVQLYTGEAKKAWETPEVIEHPYKAIKGYYFSKIDKVNKYIYLDKDKPKTIEYVTLSFPEENRTWPKNAISWKPGNKLVLINKKEYKNQITFVEAKYNIIKYKGEISFDVTESQPQYYEDYLIYNEEKTEQLNGEVLLTLGSTAPVPKFDIKMPQAPTIVGSNGKKDENGNLIKDIGILINPEAKGKDNTEINPYGVIKFGIVNEGEDLLVQKGAFDDSGIYSSWIEYKTKAQNKLGVNYEGENQSSEFLSISDIRGPEGPPGRIPQVINGNWYNWTLSNNNLVLQNSGYSATFKIIKTIAQEAEYIENVCTTIEMYIENYFIPYLETNKILTKESKFTDIVLGQLTWNVDNKVYTIACFKQSDNSIGWVNFLASGMGYLFEEGINDNSIEQYNKNINNQNKAGAKGYYYKVIDPQNHRIFLSKEQIATNEYPKIENNADESKYKETTGWASDEIQWSQGDGLSFVNDQKFDYLSKNNTATFVSAKNYNIIEYEGYIGFDTIVKNQNKIDDYTVYNVNKPEMGAVSVREGAIALGDRTLSNGSYSVSEGRETEARGNYSHAEGRKTIANYAGHAEGYGTRAYGQVSHAEGQGTEARASFSHAEGDRTIAGSMTQHVQGRFNIIDTENKYAHIVGNGASDVNRSNAYTLDWSGNAQYSGSIISKKYDNITLKADQWRFNANTNTWIYTIKIQDIDVTLTNYSDFDLIIDLNYSKIPYINKQQIYLYHKEYSKLGNGYSVIDDENAQIVVFDVKPEINLPILIKVV